MTRSNPCCPRGQCDPVSALKADPRRVAGTPARVARFYKEFFASYLEDPVQVLSRTVSVVAGYDEMIVMTDIRFESYCEHPSNKQ